jgi:hypothetical protein
MSLDARGVGQKLMEGDLFFSVAVGKKLAEGLLRGDASLLIEAQEGHGGAHELGKGGHVKENVFLHGKGGGVQGAVPAVSRKQNTAAVSHGGAISGEDPVANPLL